MTIMKRRVGSGQSPMAAQSVPSGGNVAMVPGCYTYEDNPKAEWGQTAGMKLVGPSDPHWPWRNDAAQSRVVAGIDYSQCRAYQNANPTHQQMLVRYAAGGQPIRLWLYEEAMIHYLRRAWDAAMRSPLMREWGPGPADTFIMAHMEADYLTDPDKYLSMCLSMLDSLRRPHGAWQYPIIGPDTRIAFCESPANAPLNVHNTTLQKLVPYDIKIVPANNIATIDGIHADAVGLQTMGVRAWNLLEGPGWSQ